MTDAAIPSGTLVRRIRGGLNTPLAHSVIAGAVVGVFSILFYVSYAALIFSGPVAPWLAYGLTATFITGAVGGAITSWRSSLQFAIGGPDGSTCAVIAALVATLATRLGANRADEGLLTATMAVLALSSALTGLLLSAWARRTLAARSDLFRSRLSAAFRRLRLLDVDGRFSDLDRLSLSIANIGQLLDLDTAKKLIAGIAVAAFLLMGRQYWKSPLALPAQLLVSIVIFYIALFMLRIPVAEAQSQRWLFEMPSARAFAPPWSLTLRGCRGLLCQNLPRTLLPSCL